MRLVARAQTLMTRVFGAGGPLVAGRLTSAALTFMLPLALARLLTPQLFGTYKQFFLITTTVQLMGQLGLTQSLYYFLPRGGRERGVYLSQALASLALLGLLCGLGVFLAAPQLGRWLGDGTLASLRLPLALFAGLMLAAAPLEGALLSDGRIGGSALAYVITDAVRATALIVGASLGGPAGLFWAATATAAARVVALGLLVASRTLPFARPQRAAFREQLAYALPFAGAVNLYVAQRYFSSYAVSASFDAAAFAMFAVAAFHMPVVDIVFTPLSDVMIVHVGKARHGGDTRAAWRAWNDCVQKLAAILFPATACAWLFGPTVLPLLFTHKYDGAVPLFMLITAEIPLWVMPLDALLRAVGDTRFLFVFNAARIVVTGGLVIGGIKLLGLPGAIVGGLASELLARIGLMQRGHRFLGVPMAHTVDWLGLGRTGMAAAGACAPAYAVRLLGIHGIAGVLVAGVVYCGSYLVLVRALSRGLASAIAAGIVERARIEKEASL